MIEAQKKGLGEESTNRQERADAITEAFFATAAVQPLQEAAALEGTPVGGEAGTAVLDTPMSVPKVEGWTPEGQ